MNKWQKGRIKQGSVNDRILDNKITKQDIIEYKDLEDAEIIKKRHSSSSATLPKQLRE